MNVKKNYLVILIVAVVISCNSKNENPITKKSASLKSKVEIKKVNDVVADSILIKKLIPKNWGKVLLVKGDLNKDGLDDLILGIEKDAKEANLKEVSSYDISVSMFSSDEEIKYHNITLLVYFKDKIENKYNLITKNDKLIVDAGNMMGEISSEIKNNKLTLSVSISGTYHNNDTYLFRYQNNQLLLIGMETSYVHRSDGQTGLISCNFLTGKYYTTYGTIENDKETPKKWGVISNRKLIEFSELGEIDMSNIPSLSF